MAMNECWELVSFGSDNISFNNVIESDGCYYSYEEAEFARVRYQEIEDNGVDKGLATFKVVKVTREIL